MKIYFYEYKFRRLERRLRWVENMLMLHSDTVDPEAVIPFRVVLLLVKNSLHNRVKYHQNPLGRGRL